MTSFDYNAPAELFLSKPAKVAAPSIAVSQQRLRPFGTPSRTCAHPKPLAHGLRLGMNASTASKSSACTKPVIIPCANLMTERPRARVRNETDRRATGAGR